MLSIVSAAAVSSWSVERCINDDFDVTTNDGEKAKQLLLIAERNREIARSLVFMMTTIE